MHDDPLIATMPKRKRAEAQTAETSTQPTKNISQLVSGKRKKGTKSTNYDDSTTPSGGVQTFTLPYKGKEVICERRGTGVKPALIFTHGAGGGLSNPAMKEFADGFAEVSPVVCFQGTMNLKSRIDTFQTVVEHEDTQPALGGRSMGARAAVLTAQQTQFNIKALVLASYPMVGAQKGDSRERILLDLPEEIDVLFITGTKDSMCDLKHLHNVIEKMKARSWVLEVQGADHGMSFTPKAGVQPIRKESGTIAAHWQLERDESKCYCSLSWSAKDGKVVSTGWQSSPVQQKAGTSSIKNWAKPVK